MKAERSFCAVACFVVVLAACKDDPAPGPAPQARAAERDPAPVALLEPGAEPRRVLAYTSGSGPRTVDLDVRFAPGLLRLEIAWTPSSSNPPRWAYEVRDAELPAMAGVGEQEQRIFDVLAKTFEMQTGHATAHGSSDFELVSTTLVSTSPSIPYLLDLLVVPLPQAPIGVGARWTVTRTRSYDGLQEVGTRTYELTSFQDDHADIAVRGEAELTRPANAADASLVFGAVSLKTEGTVRVKLDDLLPRAGNLSVAQQMQIQRPDTDDPSSTAPTATDETLDITLELRLSSR